MDAHQLSDHCRAAQYAEKCTQVVCPSVYYLYEIIIQVFQETPLEASQGWAHPPPHK